MNDALKDLFGPMIETMLQGEMDHHLGYASNDKGPKKDSNRRNGCRASYSITETLYQRFGDLLFFKQ